MEEKKYNNKKGRNRTVMKKETNQYYWVFWTFSIVWYSKN
jgi:hypothetical protein